MTRAQSRSGGVARVSAQAKVNLVLRVLARETSGYHSLETLFLRIDLADAVTVRVTAGRSLDCSGSELPTAGLGPTEKNLAFRAAAAYTEATGWPDGFAIEIEKRIPVGGGLGGGSADAGAVLRALDTLSPAPLGRRLVEIAAPLGADVPFMSIESPMALAWGRGERLFPIQALARRPLLVVVPGFGVSSADAYGWLASARGSYVPEGEVLAPEALATWEALAAIATNDFERVVAMRHPEVAELVDELRSMDAVVAMMSGSGSAVFGVFDAPQDAAALIRSNARQGEIRAFQTYTSERVSSVEVLG
jgi:4-diphosphocytidyl-2-C-methyl-D-erythritol kinase